jgi:transposase
LPGRQATRYIKTMDEVTFPLPSAVWDTVPPAAQALIVLQQQRIAGLEARLQELEARLGQNSTNSSRPPSSDLPKPPRRLPGPSGRHAGGQPGHEAHQRALLPPEQVDRMVDHWPEQCQRCGQAVPVDPHLVVGEPVRYQVMEVPALRATVTEHRLHRVRCRQCGESTRATLPTDVPRGAFGPRLLAVVALLVGRYRLSRREVAAVCADLLGVDLAVGSVDGLCQDAAAALAAPMAQLEKALPGAAALHADETPWPQAGQRRWLWVVTGAALTVFRIAQSRGSVVIKGLLGEDFAGRLTSDRWSGYSWLALSQRQVCWAHLIRDFQAVIDWNGPGRPLAEQLLVVMGEVFGLWHQARDRPELREWFMEQVAPLQAEVRSLLAAGLLVRDPKLPSLSGQLLKLWPALWTFVTVVGVEPTNNRAEQAIRPAVLWRKGSFGTQSEGGARFVERVLSVAATCKQQGRPLLDYLTNVCTAAQQGQPIPLLLPSPSELGA